MQKLNCWQFKNCGREKGGLLAETLGECPAAAQFKYDGINDGRGAGRACWMIPKPPSSPCFRTNCQNCEFYRRVLFEEQSNASCRLTSVSV
ncbi:MAG: hypothetical protein NDJ18_07560 [candidate division Zixibacteria bacterium]|nr:hypothetical protein [candidate division Zixibacteria bacterium]